MDILKELLSLAQTLDDKGLVSFASRLDSIASTVAADDSNDAIKEIIGLMSTNMHSGSSFEEALRNSLQALHDFSDEDAESIASFAKDLSDNGLEIEDAILIGISEVVHMHSESDFELNSSSKDLLMALGLSEEGTRLDDLNFEDNPLLVNQLEMLNESEFNN